ncbi:hypothetical protein M9458_024567, partial [Cirrhinus mrigala]
EKGNRDITGGMGAMYMNEPEKGHNAAHIPNLIFLASLHALECVHGAAIMLSSLS